MKYDKHHIDKIINSLNEGDGRVRACANAGISYQCFLDWLNDPNKIEFLEAVKKAEDSGNDKIKDICKRRIIEDKSWQSAAWWLERNYFKEFGNKQENTIKVDSKDLGYFSVFTNQELKTLAKLGIKEKEVVSAN